MARLARVLKGIMNSYRLQTRLDNWQEKLAVVERAMDEELQKHYSSRSDNLLLFLYREKVVCIGVISELRALAEEEEAASNI
jgi:hypothetical protein